MNSAKTSVTPLQLKTMQLMTEKGLLTRSERFGSHVYEASVPKEQTQRQIAGYLLRRAFGGSARNLSGGGWLLAARMRSMLVRRAPRNGRRHSGDYEQRSPSLIPMRLLVSALVQVPMVVGWLRPAILVPVGAHGGLPADYLEALLLHELARIRRYDYLTNILQNLADSLLFYHPAVWWVSRHIRAECELCCDDLAVSVTGDALTYTPALAQLRS